MIDKNIPEDLKDQEDEFKYILTRCPECKAQKFLKVPRKIINQSKNLTTVSVPAGIICEHYFQVFIDKYFSVRGYHVVDFEFPKMEFFESETEDEQVSDLSSLPLFKDIINLLRNSVDDREILGAAIFTVEGKVLYASLENSTLLNTIREFEVRKEEKLHSIIKMFLELKNHQKVCSEYIIIKDIELILILLFAKSLSFGICQMELKKIINKLLDLT